MQTARKLITRSVRQRQEEWDVLTRDHHESYISWNDL